MQLLIAAKMKEDMRLVKDEWQAYAGEKELELKKQEAKESLRIKDAQKEM